MKETVTQINGSTDPNKDPNNPAWDAVRTTVTELISEGEISGRRLATESGVSESALNQFINRKEGHTRYDRVTDRLQMWLDTRQRRQAAMAAFPDAPGFRLTNTSQRIMDAFMFAHHMPAIAGVCGAAGIGKTETAREYVRNNSGVSIATMSKATRSVNLALREISKGLGVSGGRTQAHLFDAICDELKQTRGLLIIDEAHDLTADAVDQIRKIHDRAGVGIVLMGNETVYSDMTTGKKAAYLDRVYSRVGMWLKLSTARRAANVHLDMDANTLLDAWKIQEAASRKELLQVASLPGALRLMVAVIRFARMLAGDSELQAKHIRIARKKMGPHVTGGAA